jgi:CRP-like cAMP-binding protein
LELRNHLLNSLSPNDREAFEPHLKLVSLASGDVLFEPDQPADRVYFPNTAVLSVMMVMEDGRTVETDTVGNESAVGVVAALGASLSVNRTLTQIPGTASMIPAPRLRQIAEESPGLRTLLLRHAQINLAQAHQSVACNALHGVEQRLCRWLLASQDRTDRDVVELTQQYLATMVGVQRTTITQVLRDLTAAGLIRQGRRYIEILDRKGMEARTCECYFAVRATAKRVAGFGDATHRVLRPLRV